MSKDYRLWTVEEEDYLFNQLPQAMAAKNKAAAMTQAFGRPFSVMMIYNKSLRGPSSASPIMAIPDPKGPIPQGVSIPQMIALLENEGYQLARQVVPNKAPVKVGLGRYEGTTVTLGIVADTHLGSVHEQLGFLNVAYDYFAEKKIPYVLHVGDLTEGEGLYRGQEYEIHVHGADGQRDYAINEYPRRKDIQTIIVGGSHDYIWLRRSGYNILKAICQERDDMIFVGDAGGNVNLDGVEIYMHHPRGGVPYARTYRLQKVIENFAPEHKPQVLVAGHMHVTSVLPMYRNVFAMQAGCFQAQTHLLKEMGVYPELGFSVLSILKNPIDRPDGLTRFTYSWHPFYVPEGTS